MATYNGEKYVREQIESILPQLGPHDELVIVDDASRDGTVAIIRALDDPRIVIHESSQNQGYVRAFEQAIAAARGEVIFLSDQDDIWRPGRVDRMVAALSDSLLVVTNFAAFGGALTPVQSRRLRGTTPRRWLANIFWVWTGLRPYYGCCMAFRRELVDQLLPFPSYVTETHDQWVGYVGNANRGVVHLAEDTIDRRVHGSNASARGNRPVRVVLGARRTMALAAVEAMRRVRRRGRIRVGS
jgi:glycosyltransferase involved in cell wall biosynthesis